MASACQMACVSLFYGETDVARARGKSLAISQYRSEDSDSTAHEALNLANNHVVGTWK